MLARRANVHQTLVLGPAGLRAAAGSPAYTTSGGLNGVDLIHMEDGRTGGRDLFGLGSLKISGSLPRAVE